MSKWYSEKTPAAPLLLGRGLCAAAAMTLVVGVVGGGVGGGFQQGTDDARVTILVQNADGMPVGNAKVFLRPNKSEKHAWNGTELRGESEPFIFANGGIVAAGASSEAPITTNADGGVTCSTQSDPDYFLVSAESGYVVHRWFKGDPRRLQLSLTPWGKVSGTLNLGGRPAPAGQMVILQMELASTVGATLLEYVAAVSTTKTGAFSFDAVPAGEALLTTQVAMRVSDQRVIVESRQLAWLTVQAGANTNVAIGGDGVSVAGRLVRAKQSQWDFARARLVAQQATNGPKPGARVPQQYPVQVKADGSFLVHDVTPGTYAMRAEGFRHSSRPDSASPRRVGYSERRIEIKATPAGKPNVVDLGAIELDPTVSLDIGDEAPRFDLMTIDGQRVNWDGLKGKYVLLHFWASWCGPCEHELPFLKATLKRFRPTGTFFVISISVSDDVGAVATYVREHGLDWGHLSLPKELRADLVKRYGVYSLPTNILVGPDGKVVATDLRNEKIESAVASLLTPPAKPRDKNSDVD